MALYTRTLAKRQDVNFVSSFLRGSGASEYSDEYKAAVMYTRKRYRYPIIKKNRPPPLAVQLIDEYTVALKRSRKRSSLPNNE